MYGSDKGNGALIFEYSIVIFTMSLPIDVAEGKTNDDEFVAHYRNAPTRRRRLNILLPIALSFTVILLLFLLNYSDSRGISSTTRLLKISPLTVETRFKRIEELEDFSPAADGVWEDLFTANGGFIVREIDGKQHRIGISMFHQLHCLRMIRSLMQSLANNTESTVDDLSKHFHEAHCFSYLVQVRVWSSLFCS